MDVSRCLLLFVPVKLIKIKSLTICSTRLTTSSFVRPAESVCYYFRNTPYQLQCTIQLSYPFFNIYKLYIKILTINQHFFIPSQLKHQFNLNLKYFDKLIRIQPFLVLYKEKSFKRKRSNPPTVFILSHSIFTKILYVVICVCV